MRTSNVSALGLTPRLATLLVALVLGGLVGSACGSVAGDEKRGKITLIEPEDDPDRFVIPRDTYEDHVARGPSWFIQQVRVEPVVVGRSFRGFMLTRIFGEQKAHGLAAGDIVQAVNGRSIERPGQFMRVWKELKGAQQLTVRIVRRNQPLNVTWVIR